MPSKPARDKDEAEDLIKRLDAYVAASSKEQMFNIVDYQSRHLSYMLANYNRFIGQFETFFCCMTDYAHNINYLKKDWPRNRGMQYVITTAALKQLHSAFTLLNNGAYEDSIAILRSAHESFLRVLFISLNPDHAGNAYVYRGQTGPKFNATNLVEQELKLGWTQYDIMSVFAHSNMYQVIEDLVEISTADEQKPVTLTFKKDDDMISLITNFMNFIITVFLRLYDELFTVNITQHDGKEQIQPHLDLLHEYALITQEALSTHNSSEYWRLTAVDLDDIFELLDAVESTPSLDWKMKWRKIRQT